MSRNKYEYTDPTDCKLLIQIYILQQRTTLECAKKLFYFTESTLSLGDLSPAECGYQTNKVYLILNRNTEV